MARIVYTPVMMKTKNWFEIDKHGLAQILARKGKEFAVFELIQNCWDEPYVTITEVSLRPDTKLGHAFLSVLDDAPDGFRNLADAYTLFAPSAKKENPEQRGRFNLGEKLVLALASAACVATTTGTVRFSAKGRQHLTTANNRRTAGSEIQAVLRMTAAEIKDIVLACARLLPPPNIRTTINGLAVTLPPLKHKFDASLMTEIASPSGELLKVTRKTVVQVYAADACHPAAIYEMGIPVCEIEGKYVFNVMQKVPLTIDREEVSPQFRKQLAVAALNALSDQLDVDDVNTGWAAQAVTSPDAEPKAIEAYMDKRFGNKRVAYDPSDLEANKIAVSKGYTIVHGAMLSGDAWRNVKNAGAIAPAGKVTPSAKVWTGEDNPDAIPFKDWIPEERWTPGMQKIAAFAQQMALKTIDRHIVVKFCATAHHLGAASYGPGGELIFNKFRLGNEWFEQGITQDVLELLIHEFGHQYSLDHLSEEYYAALCRIGARLWATK